jgi:flagellin
MALRVTHNIASMVAQRHLAVNTTALNKSLERLSSGYRINHASDDAAGLAISQGMRGLIAGLSMAHQNAGRAATLLQVAEGGTEQIHAMLTRLKELATEAADASISSDQRQLIEAEKDEIVDEIDKIANSTKFNDTSLLDGTFSGTFQVGAANDVNDQIGVTISGATQSDLGVDSLDFTTASGAQSALDTIDTAVQSLSALRGDIGAYSNKLEYAQANLAIGIQNTQAAESVIRDVDIALETAALTRNQLLVQSGTAMLAQANMVPTSALTLLGGI